MRAWPLISAVVLLACEAPPATREPFIHASREELRPTDTSSGLMWRFQATDQVESYGVDGGGFLVHFTRAGVNAVPAADADDSGVPDFVELAASSYEEVGALYHGPLGYRRPVGDGTIADNGGDGRFDVYLIDFARAADGAFRVDQCPTASPNKCIGYIVQENDFAGYGYPSVREAIRILASHEYFHAVQAAYDDDSNVVISEGTAEWATERFDPSTGDLDGYVYGYLDRPDRSIDSAPPGPVPSFAYGSGIFWKFLSEHHDDALIRKLWEHLENGAGDPTEPADQANPTFVVQLDALLKRDYQSSFAKDFETFATWNFYTSSAADPAIAYQDGAKYPLIAVTPVGMPNQVDGLRVFYASAQYFQGNPGARTRVTGALTDSALTATNDLEGMALWLAAKKNGKITELVKVTNGGESVDISGGVLIAAVINTNRGANGASLSQRPGLCLGTADEVARCLVNLGAAPVDAGVDAGMELDAGVEPVDAGVDGGMNEPPPPAGCGCGMGTVPLWFLGLAALGRRRRNGGTER